MAKKMNPKQVRTKLRMNQRDFWSRVGIGQSGGSRYESHRRIPAPVQTLLDIAYGAEAQASKIVAQLRGS